MEYQNPNALGVPPDGGQPEYRRKLYYDRATAPLKFHKVLHYVLLPMNALAALTTAFAADSPYLDITPLGRVYSLILLLLVAACFAGFFEWKPYGWYAVMAYIVVPSLYAFLLFLINAVDQGQISPYYLGQLLGSSIYGLLLFLYYRKRKPLFFTLSPVQAASAAPAAAYTPSVPAAVRQPAPFAQPGFTPSGPSAAGQPAAIPPQPAAFAQPAAHHAPGTFAAAPAAVPPACPPPAASPSAFAPPARQPAADCPFCGAALDSPSSAFCRKCGKKVLGLVSPAPAAPAHCSPQAACAPVPAAQPPAAQPPAPQQYAPQPAAAPASRFCPGCGEPAFSATAAFCRVCGKRLPPADVPVPAAQIVPAAQTYASAPAPAVQSVPSVQPYADVPAPAVQPFVSAPEPVVQPFPDVSAAVADSVPAPAPQPPADPIPKVCPNCGEQALHTTSLFCRKCGTRL